jgi:hypothetical protein
MRSLPGHRPEDCASRRPVGLKIFGQDRTYPHHLLPYARDRPSPGEARGGCSDGRPASRREPGRLADEWRHPAIPGKIAFGPGIAPFAVKIPASNALWEQSNQK